MLNVEDSLFMLNVEDNLMLQIKSQPLKIKKLAFTNLPCSRHRATPDVTLSVTMIAPLRGAGGTPVTTRFLRKLA